MGQCDGAIESRYRGIIDFHEPVIEPENVRPIRGAEVPRGAVARSDSRLEMVGPGFITS